MEKCYIYYDEDFMFRSGHDCEPGDTVRWLVCKLNEGMRKPELDKEVDYFYSEYTDIQKNWFIIEGRISGVELVYEDFQKLRYHPELWEKYPVEKCDPNTVVAVRSFLIETDRIDHSKKPTVDGVSTFAYLVELADYTLRTATKEDIENYSDKVNGE